MMKKIQCIETSCMTRLIIKLECVHHKRPNEHKKANLNQRQMMKRKYKDRTKRDIVIQIKVFLIERDVLTTNQEGALKR